MNVLTMPLHRISRAATDTLALVDAGSSARSEDDLAP